MQAYFHQQLSRMAQRRSDLDFLLARPDIQSDLSQFMALSREHAALEAATSRWARHQALSAELQGARELADDPDLGALAAEDLTRIPPQLAQLQAELQRLLLPKDPDDARNAYLEVRAGAGGEESALWAAELLRMYLRWADRRGWRAQLISESSSDLGGLKEAVLHLQSQSDDADGVYGALKFESGGHRVQRVPVTEAQGRIHTSAATVAVMPEPDEAVAVALNPADLRIDTFRASGAGGQHINKTDSAVRVTHLPSGLVAECQDGRSQHANKAQALRVLTARLQERDRRERAAREAAQRKSLVGTGDRSDRIRTYNFAQGRVTDHRINLTLYKLQSVLDGDLSDLLAALQAHEAAAQLAALQAD